MKKIYLIMAFACLTASYSYGQGNDTTNTKYQDDNQWRDRASFGVKIGTNYSNVYDVDGESFTADPKFGLALGVFIAIPIGKSLGIQPEVLFSQKGYKAKGNLLGSSYEITRTSNYIDVPLLVTVKPVEAITILAGPQYSFLLSQKNKFENGQTTIEQEEEFDRENLRKNTVCFTGGVDLNFDQMVVGVRAGWDLFNNNGDGTTTTPRYKNAWYQLTLGYRF